MKLLRLLASLTLLASMFALPACTGGSSQSGIKVGFVSNNPAEFWTICDAGAKKAAAEEKVELIFRRPANPDAADQKQIIDAMLAQGVNAISVSVIDPVNQINYLDRIAERVPLICVDNDARDSKRLCYIGTDNYEAGRAVGKLVKEAMPGGGVIAIFVGQIEAINARQRRQGVLDELADQPPPKDLYSFELARDEGNYGKYRLHGTFTDNVDQKVAKDKATTVLGQLEAEKDICLIGLWAYNPPAILNAVKSKNKEGQVKIVGFDEDFVTLDGVADGHIYATVVQDPFMFGYRSVKMMAALAKGDKSVVPAGGVEYVPHRIINKDGGKDRLAVAPFRKELEERLGKK